MPKKKQQSTPEQEQPGVDFRPVLSNGTYAIALYIGGQLDEVVFTLHRESRDVTARRLSDAFATLFNLGLEMGSKYEQAQQYLASPEAQPTQEELDAQATMAKETEDDAQTTQS